MEPVSGNHRRGTILTDPIVLQRIEGGVLLVIALVLYATHSGPWLLFVLLILAPDAFMAGLPSAFQDTHLGRIGRRR